MQGKYKDYKWITYGKDLVIYRYDSRYDDFSHGLVSVAYRSSPTGLVLDKIQVKNYNYVYDKELSEYLKPDELALVNKVRSQIVEQAISSMKITKKPRSYRVYAPEGVSALAIENVLKRAGIEARVREENDGSN